MCKAVYFAQIFFIKKNRKSLKYNSASYAQLCCKSIQELMSNC